MTRVTMNKVTARIEKYGFELVRGNGYYYFARSSDKSPTLHEEGIYGSRLLNAWSIDELEEMLVHRIVEDAPFEPNNPYILVAFDYMHNHLDNK